MVRHRTAGRLVTTATLFFLLTPLCLVAGINAMNLADRQSSSGIQLSDMSSSRSDCSSAPGPRLPDSRQSATRAVNLDKPYTDPLYHQIPITALDRRLQPRVPGTVHSPISIRNDTDFANQALAEGWSGNGTSSNPYGIEGLDINCTDIDTPCIQISDTTVYFSIRHCTLRGGNWIDWPSAVIVLYHASHGYLLNNTCTSAGYGIFVSYSTLITVANSNCSCSTRSDIVVSDSTLVTLFNNTFLADTYFNIEVFSGGNIEVLNNTCVTTGDPNINLCSSGNTVANNTLTGGGLWVYGTLDMCRQRRVTDNTLNGKPLLFRQDQVGGTLPSGFGQAILVNCSQTTLGNTTVKGSSAGIVLMYCNWTTITNITCENNMDGLILYGGCNNLVIGNTFIHNGELGSGSGVSMVNSSYSILGNNTFLSNGYGIILSGDYNQLWNNTCMGSTCGIDVLTASHNTIGGSLFWGNAFGLFFSYPGVAGNLIEGNIFEGNGENAFDQYQNQNTYDYNYWSTYYGPDKNGDGIGDIAYHVTGSNNVYDYRPLMLLPGSPVTWLQIPGDYIIPYGEDLYCDLDATATPPGLDQWWLSDTTLFTIDHYGVLTNLVTLPIGTYWVQVWVSDWMGNVITAGFRVIVYGGTTTTTTILQIPLIIFIMGTVAVISTAAFVSIVGIVLLRQRRPTGPPPTEPFGDTRPPVSQWNARCPLCGSHLFGDEGFCPGCGNRVTKSRGG